MKKKLPDRDLTAVLAEDLAALNYERLSTDDQSQIKRLVLDHVGVCRRGAEQPWCLVLMLVGQEQVAVYDGSMSEWVKDVSLPLEIGP